MTQLNANRWLRHKPSQPFTKCPISTSDTSDGSVEIIENRRSYLVDRDDLQRILRLEYYIMRLNSAASDSLLNLSVRKPQNP